MLIVPYFGQWPFWFDFFLLSCRHNPSIQWLLISNNPPPEHLPANIEYQEISFADYSSSVSQKLDVKFAPAHPYKLCDLKPMYGFLHQDELQDYDFWGFCDVDVIFGNLRDFFTPKLLEYDVISCHTTRISGHLALFRNLPKLREAFRCVDNWEDIISDETNQRFDEKAFSKLFIRYKNFPTWVRKYIPGYNRLGVKSSFIERHSTPDCRIDWEDGSRIFPSEWYWNNGTLTNNNSKNTFMYFHFLYWKQYFWKTDYRDESGFLKPGNAQTFAVDANVKNFKMNQQGFQRE